uniref:Immunoglobulin-binding protein 1 n=1 Tax=Timema tahoe TaxID=61484 RepID=A0A7R9IA30_9NEOP|nr:unnamed protein product [Timema tahoe]
MAANDEVDEKKLSDLFDEGFDIFNAISSTSEATNSGKVQAEIKKAMRLLEDATNLVSLVDVFSSNETVDEVATGNIKYFLLPALLGTLSLKLCIEDRMQVVDTAEVYFRDFLKRCNSFAITNIQVPAPRGPDAGQTEEELSLAASRPSLGMMVVERSSKLQRFRDKQELEGQLKSLRQSMSNLNVDDETKRNFFLTLIKSFALEAIDELRSLEKERPLIEYMIKMKKEENPEERRKERRHPPPKPLKPIIITKNELQKQVYGLGYPSIPTMTVQEFYDKRVQDGDFPAPGVMSRNLQDMTTLESADSERELEEAEKERLVERDDPRELQRARDFDEFKDDHRRGEGNRMNRS